jgi:hypothetical protein
MPTRILYFNGGILEDSDERAPDDLVEAARRASSRYPHLTAEIWREGRKAAVVRPCWGHAAALRQPKERRGAHPR